MSLIRDIFFYLKIQDFNAHTRNRSVYNYFQNFLVSQTKEILVFFRDFLIWLGLQWDFWFFHATKQPPLNVTLWAWHDLYHFHTFMIFQHSSTCHTKQIAYSRIPHVVSTDFTNRNQSPLWFGHIVNSLEAEFIIPTWSTNQKGAVGELSYEPDDTNLAVKKTIKRLQSKWTRTYQSYYLVVASMKTII